MLLGWPYSVVAALEPGRTSWTAVLDAIRLGPEDDEAEVTAAQVREVITRLIDAGHWRDGDLPVLVQERFQRFLRSLLSVKDNVIGERRVCLQFILGGRQILAPLRKPGAHLGDEGGIMPHGGVF